MFHPTYTVLFDANVLYSFTLRNLVMYLATQGMFRARWSPHIHAEWIRNVIADRPDISRERLEQTRRLMDEHAEDCLVTGYESLIGSIDLPDDDDRHVLAAAITTRAHLIVTQNLKDFPESVVGPRFGIEVQNPDTFCTHQLDLFPTQFVAAARRHRSQSRNPPRSVDEYLAALRKCELTETVLRLEDFRGLL